LTGWEKIGTIDPAELVNLIRIGLGEEEMFHIRDYMKWKIQQN